MRFLRTNTAVRITVGPFLDKTDGVTEETGLTPTNMHIVFTTDDDDGTAVNTRIDTTLTASSGDNDIVHIAHGMWDLELTAAQTNYLGRAFLYIGDSANHCPVFHEFMILPQKVYDSLVAGSDNLEVDTIQWLGTACATPNTNGVPKVDTTKVAGTDQTAGDLKATLTNMSGATFNTATDSLEAIRDRGDAAWTSGTAQAISYAPTSVAYTIGDDESGGGTFAKLASHDDDYLQCGENATTGLEFQVLATVTGKQTENPSLVRISAFYSGSATHELTIQVYNYTSAAWNDAATMKDRTTFFDYVVPLDSDNHDPANGSMKIRFKHNTATYNAAHYLRVDYVSFEKRAVTDALASDVAQILAMVNDIDTEVDSLANDGVKLGDVAHGGTAATLTLERIVVESTTTNQPAVSLTGDGSGAGIETNGGASGNGLLCRGGGSADTAASAGAVVVGTTGMYIWGNGGTGLSAYSNGGGGNGLEFYGDGGGAGILAQGGSTGNGMEVKGGNTSGDGLKASHTGASNKDINAPDSDLGTSGGGVY